MLREKTWHRVGASIHKKGLSAIVYKAILDNCVLCHDSLGKAYMSVMSNYSYNFSLIVYFPNVVHIINFKSDTYQLSCTPFCHCPHCHGQ